MSGKGTATADLLSGNEPAAAGGIAEDTLEGATAVDPLALADTSANLFLWNVPGVPQTENDGVPPADSNGAGSEVSTLPEPIPAGDPVHDVAELMPAPAGDPVRDSAGQMSAAGGASLVAGDYPGPDAARVAIGDWNDSHWSGSVKVLPWEGDTRGGMVHDDIAGDGFGDAVASDNGQADYAYDDSYYGDGSYGGDGDGYEAGSGYDYSGYGYSLTAAGDINGDGFEDYEYQGYGDSYVMYGYEGDGYSYAGDGTGAGGGYDYSGYYGYSLTAAGDINGDGFEDYLYEGYGESSVMYGYEGDGYSYAGDGNAAGGDYSYAVGDVNGDGSGSYVIYAGDWAGHDIAIDVRGDAELVWQDDWVYVTTAGDGWVSILIDNDVALLAGDPGSLSLPDGVSLTTAGVTAALAPLYIADA